MESSPVMFEHPSGDPRKHVLQVVGNAIVGGMERCVARLVKRLLREEFRVSVLAPFESRFTEELRELGATVLIVKMTDEPSWHSIQLACALIQSTWVDVIQSHLPNAHVLAALAGKLTGRPVLAIIHGRAVTTLDIEVQRVAATHLGVVCRQSYYQALGVGTAASHLHLLPNGVDTESYAPRPRRDGPLRQRFDVAPATLLVGFVGRLSPEKGPDVFLRMAVSVRITHPSAHFVIVGEGAMLETLRLFALRFELESVLHFSGAQMDMPSVFNEIDVLVSSSHSEAMPLAMMEAMACGLPVVGCAVGGVPDLVQHGVTGWIVSDGDYEGLAAHVSDLLDDATLRAATGRAARERAVRHFSDATGEGATMDLLTRLSVDSRPIALHPASRASRSTAAVVKAVPG